MEDDGVVVPRVCLHCEEDGVDEHEHRHRQIEPPRLYNSSQPVRAHTPKQQSKQTCKQPNTQSKASICESTQRQGCETLRHVDTHCSQSSRTLKAFGRWLVSAARADCGDSWPGSRCTLEDISKQSLPCSRSAIIAQATLRARRSGGGSIAVKRTSVAHHCDQ